MEIEVVMTVLHPVTFVLRVRVPTDEEGEPDLEGAEVVGVDQANVEASVAGVNEIIGADPYAFEDAIRLALR